MIISVCPNPSVDITVSVNKFICGGLNRITGETVTFSGKGVNVIKAFSKLGGNGIATGFMFLEDADSFAKDLSSYGIIPDFVMQSGKVRRNYKITESCGKLTELNGAGNPVTSDAKMQLLGKINALSKTADAVVISGSLPSGCTPEFYGSMVSAVQGKCFKIADASGDMLLSAVKAGANFIKPNKKELEQLVGKELNDISQMLSACRELINAGTEIVLLSLGKDGAVICNNSASYYASAPKVDVKSAVGAGDSMVAASAKLLTENADIGEVLRSAVAAGTSAVMSEGTNLFLSEDYYRIYGKVSVSRID